MSSHVEGHIIRSQLLPRYIQWDWQAWWFYFKPDLQIRNWDSEWFNDLIAIEGHSLAWKGQRRALQVCQWSPGWITEKGSEQLMGSGQEAEVHYPFLFYTPKASAPPGGCSTTAPNTYTIILFFFSFFTHSCSSSLASNFLWPHGL